MSTLVESKGERTRRAILTRAAALGSERGLEALTIGGLAEELRMSKSGLFAHFGSKEELQLATIGHASETFIAEVIAPARPAPRGIARVWALCDHLVSYLERQVFPGGCPMQAGSVEFKSRPGPVRDRVRGLREDWLSYFAHAIETAQELGELRADVEPRALAFELDALAFGANVHFQLFDDPQYFAAAREAMRARLDALR